MKVTNIPSTFITASNDEHIRTDQVTVEKDLRITFLPLNGQFSQKGN